MPCASNSVASASMMSLLSLNAGNSSFLKPRSRSSFSLLVRKSPIVFLRCLAMTPGSFPTRSKEFAQCGFDFGRNQVANGAKFLTGQILWIGNLPVLAAFSANEWAFVPASHRSHKIIFNVRYFRQRFGPMLAQVVAQFAHRCDGLRIHLARGPRAGAVSLHVVTAVDAREGFGHLAAIGILDADEQDAFASRIFGSASTAVTTW